MMTIYFNIPTVVVFMLIANGMFASIMLILKVENRKANRLLSLLTFFLSLWLCDAFFRISGIYGQQPSLYFLPIYFSFGFGPLIYLYTLQLTNKELSFSYHRLFHFVPALLQFLFYGYLQSKSYAFRREFWLEMHRPYTYDIELALSLSLLLIYLILSRTQMSHYKQQIKNSFSDIHRITLRWLNQLHVALFVLSFFWLLETIARFTWNFYPITPFSSITIGFVILLIAMGSMLQKDLSQTKANLSAERQDKESPQENQEAIDPSQVERIQSILIEKELFLIPDITLKEFSQHVGLSPRETSHLINKGLNISFIDFVNQYRIERFKELAKSQKIEQLSLLGIAYESGFNSKSTFNRVFKKMEGKSPSSYLKES